MRDYSRLTSPFTVLRDLGNLGRELNQMAGETWRDLSTTPGHWTLGVDAAETEDGYHYFFDAPGVNQRDIEVDVMNRALNVRIERPRPDAQRHFRSTDENPRPAPLRYVSFERRYGVFERSVELPEDADPESVEAHCQNGVLEVVAKKTPGAQSRRVTVK